MLTGEIKLYHWLSQCQENAYVYSFPNTEKQGQLIPHLVPTTKQVNIKNAPENLTTELVKEEYRQVGLHKLLRKAVIHFSYAEFLQLKSNNDSIHSFLNLIGNHVKCPIEAAEGRQQHQASETCTNP